LQQHRQDLRAASNTSNDTDTRRQNSYRSNGDGGGGGEYWHRREAITFDNFSEIQITIILLSG